MTLNHFRIFIKVYEKCSMTAAATELHISQPAISQVIRDMEQHYGVKLFERSVNGLLPTPVALRLREHVDVLLASQDRIESMEWQYDAVQKIGLGLDTVAWDLFMPELVDRYAVEIGTCKPVLYANPTGVLMHACTTGEIDLALVSGELLPSAALTAIPLAKDELVFVCRRGSRFLDVEDGETVKASPGTFLTWPLLLPYKTSAARATFNAAMAIHNIEYQEVGNFNNSDLLLRAVVLDMGVGLISRHEKVDREKICTFRIEGLDLTSDVILIHRRSPAISPEVREMRDFITENFCLV